MSALHDTMVSKMESCEEADHARHVDMSAVLADIERSQQAQELGKQDKHLDGNEIWVMNYLILLSSIKY